MKSLMLLWQKVAHECATQCHTSTTRDIQTVTRRVEDEGVSFLTITLPQFGKDLERGLDQGVVDSSLFVGFRRAGGLPAFLGGFLRQIFDSSSGVLLPSPSVDAIRSLRQLTLMFGKIQIPCSDARLRKAIDGYVQCEQELEDTYKAMPEIQLARLRRVWTMLFGDMFARMDRELRQNDLDGYMPRHGPGATADRLVGNQKFYQSEWPWRLEEIFPAGTFIRPRWGYLFDHPVEFLEPGEERPVRVVLVPKTLKTPRVIAIEPTCMQYAQQALLGRFLEGWRRDNRLSQFLGFDDQVPNQRLALIGSVNGSLATLDLSEASDRVSNQLIQALMRNVPQIAEAYQASRSTRADVPGHGVIPLTKFASMGSALCFPVEAMVFLAIVFSSIEKGLSTKLTQRHINQFLGKVRIFGDDIIVPVEFVDHVISDLELFGFKVNAGKSFWTGKFRESCGKEYFDGHDVSVVRFRRLFPVSRESVDEVLSLVSFRNQLYYAGYWDTCQWLDSTITSMLRYFPVVEPTSPVIGRHSFLPYEAEKMCNSLHRPLVKGYVVTAKSPVNEADDFAALVKCLTSPAPSEDPEHLIRSGRPQRVGMKLRSATPY